MNVTEQTDITYLGLDEKLYPLYNALSTLNSKNTQIILGKIELINQRLENLEKKVDKHDSENGTFEKRMHEIDKTIIKFDKQKLDAATFDDRYKSFDDRLKVLENGKAKIQGGWWIIGIIGAVFGFIINFFGNFFK